MKEAWYGGGAWMNARGLLRVEGNHPPIYRNDNANVVPQARVEQQHTLIVRLKSVFVAMLAKSALRHPLSPFGEGCDAPPNASTRRNGWRGSVSVGRHQLQTVNPAIQSDRAHNVASLLRVAR